MRLTMAAVSSLFVLAGCGSAAVDVTVGSGGADAGAGADSAAPSTNGDDASAGSDGAEGPADAGPFATAPHTPMPQLSKHTGAILAKPHLVTISYAGYKYQGQVEDFGTFVVTSSWLSAVGAEYGVSAGTHEAVRFTDAAPGALTDAQIQALIEQKVSANELPAPTATAAGTPVYMLYLPSTTTVTDSSQSTSCSANGFSGYHGMASKAGSQYVYAVVPDCGTGLADVTSTAAHELIEAATDPFDSPNDGYFLDVGATNPWLGAQGNEVADMCDFEPLVTEAGWSLERSYSNAAAAAGTSPCVPVPAGDVYFNVSASPSTVQKVAAGKSATFTLTGWSSAAMAAWPLALSTADSADFDPKAVLSAKTINNGDTATVTLTAPATATSGQIGAAFVVSGDAAHFWAVAIAVQ